MDPACAAVSLGSNLAQPPFGQGEEAPISDFNESGDG
jgi:hypothetical protein